MATERLVIQVDEKGALVVKRNIESVGQSAKASAGALQLLKRALAALAGAAVIRQVIGLADAFTNVQNRLRIVTDSTEELAFVTDELFNIATRTRSEFEGTAIVYQKVALASGELGLSTKETLSFVESLNQAVVLSGADAQTASAGLRQLSQGIGAGALRGDELISVLENLPEVANIISKELGVTIGQFRQLGAEGKITSDIIIQAFENQRAEIEGNYQKTIITIGQAFTLLKNNVTRFVGELTTATGASLGFAKAIQFISLNVETIARSIGVLVTVIGVNYAKTAIPAAISATKKLGVALLANPVGVLATAITAGIAALVFFSDKIKVAGDDVTTLADVGRAAANRIKDALDEVAVVAQFAADQLLGAFDGFAQGGIDAIVSLRTVLGAITLTLDQIVGAVTGAVGVIVFAWRDLKALLDKATVDAFNAVLRKATEGLNGVITLINKGLAAIGADPIDLVNLFQVDTTKLEGAGEKAADIFFAAFNNTPLTDILEGILDDAQIAAFQRELEAIRAGGGAADDPSNRKKKDPIAEGKKQRDILAETIRSLEQEAVLLKLSNDEREKRAALFELENALAAQGKTLSKGDARRVSDLITENQGLERRNEVIGLLSDAQAQFGRELSISDEILQGGALTAEQYAAAVNQINTEVADLVKQQQVFVDIFSSVWDIGLQAIREFVRGGKILFRDFAFAVLDSISQILAALVKIQIQKSLGTALGIPGFATGGDFMVTGAGGTDSQLVAFAATPGERVRVETPAQQRAGQPPVMAAAPQQSQNIKVVNVMDPSEIRAAMAAEEGTQVIVNTLARNRTTVRQVIS